MLQSQHNKAIQLANETLDSLTAILERRNPFSLKDDQGCCVIALELSWTDIVGMDYYCPLHAVSGSLFGGVVSTHAHSAQPTMHNTLPS